MNGLRDVAVLPASARIVALRSLGRGRTVGVGWQLPRGEAAARPRIVTAEHDGTAWNFSISLAPGGDHGALGAVIQDRHGVLWAAGIRYLSLRRQAPLVVRRVAGTWQDASPPFRRGVATGIAADPDGRIWLTTVEMEEDGPATRVYVHQDGEWSRAALPAVPGVERLVSIVAPSRDRTVAVGSSVSPSGVRAVILVRTGRTWVRERVEPGAGHLVLASVAAGADGTLRAVGWRLAPGRVRPVLLVRDAGGTWRPVGPRAGTGAAALALDGDGDGGPVAAVGASYLASAGQWLPAVGAPDADPDWLVAGRYGAYLQAMTGDPLTSGWVAVADTVKAIDRDASLARLCDLLPATDQDLLAEMLRIRREREAQDAARALRVADEADRQAASLRDRSNVTPTARPPGSLTGRLILRDIAAELGLPATSGSYGITTGDVNGDGRMDLVWSRHGGPLAVYLRSEAGFVPAAGAFAPADRHTCVATPIDEDDRADIACVTGGQHGLGLTSNELYLDPLGETTSDTGTEHGLTDPVARGRAMVAFDADGDGDQDLYQAGEERLDGLPVVNRLLLNDGQGMFTWAVASRLTSSFGLGIPIAADVDGDGLTDLLVGQQRDAAAGQGIHLYLNQGGTFTDVAADVGLAPIGETDVEVAQLDGRGRLDIVQLAEGRLVISLWRGHRYVRVVDRRILDGQHVAAGDVDGDGDQDLYLALGQPSEPRNDVVLLNDGTGRQWVSLPVADTATGQPDDVVAVDLDDDERDEFVVVSGRNGPGPFRVIDAAPAPPG